jgi:hypothetical protein
MLGRNPAPPPLPIRSALEFRPGSLAAPESESAFENWEAAATRLIIV